MAKFITKLSQNDLTLQISADKLMGSFIQFFVLRPKLLFEPPCFPFHHPLISFFIPPISPVNFSTYENKYLHICIRNSTNSYACDKPSKKFYL